MKKPVLIYLASPYSSADPKVRAHRFLAVCRKAAELMQQGHYIFAAVAHSHPIAEAGDLPKGWDFWGTYARIMIERCDELYVLMLDGWAESVGVTAEIGIAKELQKPIRYIEP